MDGTYAHLIGIGGNGMRALADVLRGWGWSVSGSDMIFQGHAAENLSGKADVVIASDAIPPDNSELCRAAELGIPVLSYFQALGKITRGKLTLAIAGTHGKSTTTAMVAHVLSQAGWNPTVFCGAATIGRKSGGQAGRKDFFVVEACEYRKNFLHLRPSCAALLGIEPDHFDCFATLTESEAAYRQFAELVSAFASGSAWQAGRTGGWLLYREDCPSTQKIAADLVCEKHTFGFARSADWSAQNLQSFEGYYRFSIFHRQRFFVEVRLTVPGKYNILNALAAAAMCWKNGATAEQIGWGLETFPGLHRRFEIFGSSIARIELGTRESGLVRRYSDVGESSDCVPNLERGKGDLSFVLDYAHHPTEVAAALKTAREVFPRRRIWCIFQPHQASRTIHLLDELAASLQNADKVIVAEIFRAREGCPEPGEVKAVDLARRVEDIAKNNRDEGKVIPLYQTDDIMDALKTQGRPDDVIMVLGAGDIHDKFIR